MLESQLGQFNTVGKSLCAYTLYMCNSKIYMSFSPCVGCAPYLAILHVEYMYVSVLSVDSSVYRFLATKTTEIPTSWLLLIMIIYMQDSYISIHACIHMYAHMNTHAYRHLHVHFTCM